MAPLVESSWRGRFFTWIYFRGSAALPVRMSSSTPNLFSTRTEIVCRINSGNQKTRVPGRNCGRPSSIAPKPRVASVSNDYAGDQTELGQSVHCGRESSNRAIEGQ